MDNKQTNKQRQLTGWLAVSDRRASQKMMFPMPANDADV